MAADEVKQTSEQQMRTLQFNDKVSRLNREFIRQLQEWYRVYELDEYACWLYVEEEEKLHEIAARVNLR
ncbi:hypothetical protein OSTOST_23652 [Ostertagia ostertagi]